MNSEITCLKAYIKSNIHLIIPCINNHEHIETLHTIEDMMASSCPDGTLEYANHNYQVRCTYSSQKRGIKMFATGDSFIDAFFNLIDRYIGDDQYNEFSKFTPEEYYKFVNVFMQDDTKISFDIANSVYTWAYSQVYTEEFETIESEYILKHAMDIIASHIAVFNDRDTLFSNIITETENTIWGDFDPHYGTLVKVNASSILDARQRICEFIDHLSKEEWFCRIAKDYYSKVNHAYLKNIPFFFQSFETHLLVYQLRRIFTSNTTLQTPNDNGIITNWINIFNISDGIFQIDETKYNFWDNFIYDNDNTNDNGFVTKNPIAHLFIKKGIQNSPNPIHTPHTPTMSGGKMWRTKCFNCKTPFEVPFWILSNPNEHNDKRVCPCCSKIGINYKKCKKCNKNFFLSDIATYAKCPTCKA